MSNHDLKAELARISAAYPRGLMDGLHSPS